MSELIELIKVLRDRTGAGLMDCKKALLANDSSIEKSIDWLREKGIAKNANKAGRIAAEGLTDLKVEGDEAVMIEVNCETDFVAKADPFIALVKEVTGICFASKKENIEDLKNEKNSQGKTVAELFNEAGIKLGEKLSLRRAVVLTKKEGQLFGSYIHMKGAMSVLCVVEGKDQAFADEVAMCIASDNPLYGDIKEVPAEEFAKEKEIQLEASKNDPSFAKKPEAIQEKIINGRVEKHFQEDVFTFQEYILEPSKNMGQVLKEHSTILNTFVKFKVGEGMEHRHDDFAAEVAAQACGK